MSVRVVVGDMIVVEWCLPLVKVDGLWFVVLVWVVDDDC